MKFEYTHALSQEDVRARVKALGDYLTNRHKVEVTWNGDRAIFRGRFKRVVKIAGEMTFADTKVLFVGEDPGIVWRGQALKYIQRKLDAYLDPSVALEDLPRE